MTRQEAIQAMIDGKRVTHRHFTSDEWITINKQGKFQFEDGVECSASEFWSHRTSEDWNTDWEIFQCEHSYVPAGEYSQIGSFICSKCNHKI